MLLRHWQQRPSEHTQSHTTCTNSTLQHKATPHVPIRLRSQPHSQLPAQIHTRHHSGLHTQLRLSSSSVSRSASRSSLLAVLGLIFSTLLSITSILGYDHDSNLGQFSTSCSAQLASLHLLPSLLASCMTTYFALFLHAWIRPRLHARYCHCTPCPCTSAP